METLLQSEENSEEFILFFDANFGRRIVPTAVRAAGQKCEVHLDHFAENALDVEWLPTVGTKGWFVVTKDENIADD